MPRGMRGIGGDKDLAAYFRLIQRVDGVEVRETGRNHFAVYVDGRCVYTAGGTSRSPYAVSEMRRRVGAALRDAGKSGKKGSVL